MPKRVRLSDIANLTGYSTNTISLALRGSPRIPVQTRALIEEASLRLGYLPNHIAKALVKRETKTIGLVLTDITSPILTRMAQVIETELSRQGYGTLLASSGNKIIEEKRVLEMLRSRQVDGLLMYPASHRDLSHLRSIRSSGTPVVLLAGTADCGLDVVHIDEFSGAYKATRHLIESGHIRVGLIDGDEESGNSSKREGYSEALAVAGISPDESLLADPRGASVQCGYRATEALMRVPNPPTAIFAANDSLAVGTLRWCAQNRVSVPQELAVVGFDNTEYAEHSMTPISSVDYPVSEVATQALTRLFQLMAAQGSLSPPQIWKFDPDLIVRASSQLVL